MYAEHSKINQIRGKTMKYHIHAKVDRADGYTTFEIYADNKEQAIKLFNNGGGQYIDDDINILGYMELGLDDIEEIKE